MNWLATSWDGWQPNMMMRWESAERMADRWVLVGSESTLPIAVYIDAYSSSASRKFRTTSFAIAQLWHGLAMTRSLLLLVSIDISEARPLWQLWQRLLWEQDISEPTLADLAVTLSNYCRLSLVLHPALLHIELDRTGIICFSIIFSSLFLSVLFLTLIFGAEFHAAFLLARFCPCAPTSSSATWQLSICACVQVTMRPIDRKLGTQRRQSCAVLH